MGNLGSCIRLFQLGSLVLILGPGSASGAAEAESWWQFCEPCHTDADFRTAAIEAPGVYSIIYVTNRDTEITRKFSRFYFREDRFGDTSVMIEVAPVEFPPMQKQVFDTAVQGANEGSAEFQRDAMNGVMPAGDLDSVLGEFEADRLTLNTGFFFGLRQHLKDENFLPTLTEVSFEAGVQIAGTGVHRGEGQGIRRTELNITVTYDDGTVLRVVQMPDGTFTELEIRDADGTILPVENPTKPLTTPIATEFLDGREYSVSQRNLAPGFVDTFLETIEARSGGLLICEWKILGAGNTQLLCRRVS
ncbi:MAG: hypothetical protein RQ741_09925 [Wenzhouxiangellaceae bacterium]|nr:hypothetical protein [Wenzhouxiangellaceae bacterium]